MENTSACPKVRSPLPWALEGCLWATLHGGGAPTTGHVGSGVQGQEVREGCPQLEVNPGLPLTGKGAMSHPPPPHHQTNSQPLVPEEIITTDDYY